MWPFRFLIVKKISSHSHGQICSNHSVEILSFFYHSDFSWNHFQEFWRSKNCHFTHFDVLNFDFLWILHFLKAEIYKNHYFRTLKIAKMAFFELWQSSKLISRKTWVTKKFWIFHTVPWTNLFKWAFKLHMYSLNYEHFTKMKRTFIYQYAFSVNDWMFYSGEKSSIINWHEKACKSM